MYYSDAKQDSFVSNLLKFKTTGFYLDIGSAHAKNNSNTYHFDSIGWKGICIENDPVWVSSYELRSNCHLVCHDALTLDYEKVLSDFECPKEPDYLSLDVDEMTTDILNLLPLKKWRFKVITIEHDYYRFGDKYRKVQRDFLSSLGYLLLCSDVFIEQPPPYSKENASFEDWWVFPSYFEMSELNKVNSSNSYPSQIISKFGDKNNWYR